MIKVTSYLSDPKNTVELDLFSKFHTIPKNAKRLNVKDLVSHYFPLPTAAHVHSYFEESSKKNYKKTLNKVEHYLLFFLEKIHLFFENNVANVPEYNASHINEEISLKVPHLPDPAFIIPEPHPLTLCEVKEVFYEPYHPPCLLIDSALTSFQLIDYEAELLSFLNSHLTLQGSLQLDSSKMAYLSLKQGAFLLNITPKELLSLKGTEPRLDIEQHALGAHIPVMLPIEWKKGEMLGIQNELNKTFSFTMTRAFVLDHEGNESIEKAWHIEIACPELNELREKYLLPGKLYIQPFSIVFCILKRKQTSKAKAALYRLNVSCFAA
jgi:hypothetical protein